MSFPKPTDFGHDPDEERTVVVPTNRRPDPAAPPARPADGPFQWSAQQPAAPATAAPQARVFTPAPPGVHAGGRPGMWQSPPGSPGWGAHHSMSHPPTNVPPVGWQPHDYGRPPRRRRTLVLTASVAAVAVMALLVAVALSNRGGTQSTAEPTPPPTPTPPPASPVQVTALPSLLLSPIDVAKTAGAVTMIGERVYEAMNRHSIVDQECIGLLPAEQKAYEGSGYTSVRQQHLDSPAKDKRSTQAVVSFPDAASAANFVAEAKAKWQKCANRSVNFRLVEGRDDSANSFWSIAAVSEVDGILTTSRYQEGGAGWVCQSGLAARNNIVIDFFICGDNVGPSVVPSFVAQVNERIEAQQ